MWILWGSEWMKDRGSLTKARVNTFVCVFFFASFFFQLFFSSCILLCGLSVCCLHSTFSWVFAKLWQNVMWCWTLPELVCLYARVQFPDSRENAFALKRSGVYGLTLRTIMRIQVCLLTRCLETIFRRNLSWQGLEKHHGLPYIKPTLPHQIKSHLLWKRQNMLLWRKPLPENSIKAKAHLECEEM